MSKAQSAVVWLAVSAAVVVVLHGTLVGAQSDPSFEIQTSEPNLEQEYRDELDKWMLRAYEGDRDAQFKVGVLFTNDQFGPPDFEQAVYWYKQAARQGHVLAQYNLGHQYLTGVGVQKSEESAMRWWLEAAKQDHALAQFNVGRAYYLGIGLPEDHTQSKYWFERAASNQEPKSIDILRQLGWWDGQLSTDTIQPEIASAGAVDEAGLDPNLAGIELSPRVIPIEPPVTTDEVEEPEEESEYQQVATTDSVAIQESQSEAGNSEEDEEAVAVADTPAVKDPIALYTNPAVRSVLIAIVDDRDSLREIERSDDWVTVQSSAGFPVWVHSDFLRVSDNLGTVTGEAVNARSVPIITNGTVVGKLNKGESLTVLDKRKSWYRVMAPARFEAWAKVSDVDRDPITAGPVETEDDSAVEETTEPVVSTTEPENEPSFSPPAGTLGLVNDNEWLFGQPADHYTLQLASFDDPAKVEEFVSRVKFRNNPELHRFTASGKNIEWTYFLYGSFESRDKAESAKVEINQKRAWIRSFGRLQQNRCVSWKTKLPTPKELNRYCKE